MIDFHPHADPCERCDAVAWECIGEFVPHKGPPQDVIECAFCGVRRRVKAVAATAKPQPETATAFRFQYGRFAGKTLAEVDAEPNGRRYLEVLRDSNEKLRGRIEEYFALDSAG